MYKFSNFINELVGNKKFKNLLIIIVICFIIYSAFKYSKISIKDLVKDIKQKKEKVENLNDVINHQHNLPIEKIIEEKINKKEEIKKKELTPEKEIIILPNDKEEQLKKISLVVNKIKLLDGEYEKRLAKKLTAKNKKIAHNHYVYYKIKYILDNKEIYSMNLYIKITPNAPIIKHFMNKKVGDKFSLKLEDMYNTLDKKMQESVTDSYINFDSKLGHVTEEEELKIDFIKEQFNNIIYKYEILDIIPLNVMKKLELVE